SDEASPPLPPPPIAFQDPPSEFPEGRDKIDQETANGVGHSLVLGVVTELSSVDVASRPPAIVATDSPSPHCGQARGTSRSEAHSLLVAITIASSTTTTATITDVLSTTPATSTSSKEVVHFI
ncbi:unnamed protein product, partial [Protopolystoma xenopodis]